jgi:CheY-like chemotaxis protein
MTRAVGNKNRLHDAIAPVASQSADWTILVVDDEPGILEVIRRVLKHVNYNVIPSRSGDDAWDILERNRPSIDLVLTDIVMSDRSTESFWLTRFAKNIRTSLCCL